MVFNSYEFMLMFLPVFIIGFYKKNANELFRDIWIILGSLLFYAFFGANHLLIIIISILWNICTAIPMSFMRDQNTEIDLFGKKVLPQKIWLTIGIAGNLSMLIFFKLGSGIQGLFYPLAISFYTFNQISYIVDLYRGEIKEFIPIKYLSYILFFPKLLQGPIMDYNSYTSQLEISYNSKLDFERILRGALLLALGMFKKVIVADTFGSAVDYAFGSLIGLGSLEALLTAVFYSFQLYFDFSGYCDMASGICLMFGFELPINFKSPYKAIDIVDFWKRWHITLTGFFTRYIYIPLGGSRKGKYRTYINIMIIFLISGFWHGTGITFIIWGAMHGVLYVITRVFEKKGEKKKNPIKVILTFIYVTVAWVFFRAESISEALILLGRIFTGGKKGISTGLSSCFQLDELWYVIKVTPIMKFGFAWDVCLWLFLTLGAIVVFFAPSAIQFTKKSKIGIKTTLITAILLIWCIVSFGGVSTFLYMNF
ncbi:MAG: MBOAT family protein [Butyrivibrio sp.]|nr:MBOAT family protein [Butyrivibrio sp.]